MRHRFITGDSLSAMRKIPDRSVDLVLGSPPYADARTYGIGFRLKGEPYVEWCIERYLECDRICRGMVVWVIDTRVQKFQWGAEPVLLAADLHRRGIKLRRLNFYYRFGVSGSGGPDDLRNDCELILRSSHGRLPWSDNCVMGHPPKFPPGGAFSNRSKDGTRQAKRDYKPPEIANPGNVLKMTVGGGHMGHPLAKAGEAPFPLKLAEFYVRSFCPPGGTVLDPFAGTGTVMHAAEIHGRNSINIDIRRSQIDIMKERLNDITSDPEKWYPKV